MFPKINSQESIFLTYISKAHDACIFSIVYALGGLQNAASSLTKFFQFQNTKLISIRVSSINIGKYIRWLSVMSL